ncbi:MAG: hypothetical protein HZC40_26715 [Chloroflexi bacterium]|nr:hypothetical protein [Chloroflexota bacterium]
METAITGLIVIGLLILVVVGLAFNALTAQATLADAARVMQERAGERARTNLAPVSATTSGAGDQVFFTVKNAGTQKLADYEKWDVILQYSDGATNQIKWYPYGMGANRWSAQIYQVVSPVTAEVFEPGVFNPGEEIYITVNVAPNVGASTLNLAKISTPNGITASLVFTR